MEIGGSSKWLIEGRKLTIGESIDGIIDILSQNKAHQKLIINSAVDAMKSIADENDIEVVKKIKDI